VYIHTYFQTAESGDEPCSRRAARIHMHIPAQRRRFGRLCIFPSRHGAHRRNRRADSSCQHPAPCCNIYVYAYLCVYAYIHMFISSHQYAHSCDGRADSACEHPAPCWSIYVNTDIYMSIFICMYVATVQAAAPGE